MLSVKTKHGFHAQKRTALKHFREVFPIFCPAFHPSTIVGRPATACYVNMYQYQYIPTYLTTSIIHYLWWPFDVRTFIPPCLLLGICLLALLSCKWIDSYRLCGAFCPLYIHELLFKDTKKPQFNRLVFSLNR